MKNANLQPQRAQNKAGISGQGLGVSDGLCKMKNAKWKLQRYNHKGHKEI